MHKNTETETNNHIAFYHCDAEAIILPLPPSLGRGTSTDMEIYARFMRALRMSPVSRPETRILTAIQGVADALYLQDAEVTATLVELGLRAPRSAFPESYLDFADAMLLRGLSFMTVRPTSLQQLQDVWFRTDPDKFGAFSRPQPIIIDCRLVPAG